VAKNDLAVFNVVVLMPFTPSVTKHSPLLLCLAMMAMRRVDRYIAGAPIAIRYFAISSSLLLLTLRLTLLSLLLLRKLASY
jgi:hypothetical protein